MFKDLCALLQGQLTSSLSPKEELIHFPEGAQDTLHLSPQEPQPRTCRRGEGEEEQRETDLFSPAGWPFPPQLQRAEL